MMSRGVFAGISRPNSELKMKSGTPDSMNVGTCGTAAERALLVIAIGRTRPVEICAIADGSAENMIDT